LGDGLRQGTVIIACSKGAALLPVQPFMQFCKQNLCVLLFLAYTVASKSECKSSGVPIEHGAALP
jgi:hypothetical protein